MKLDNPLYYSGIGKREVNEDFLFPENPKENDNVFLVCDGVGGMAFGELASKFTAMAVQNYLQQIENITASHLPESLHFANSIIQKFSNEHPKAKGMSSTIALLVKNENHFYASWVGDSRIYHIRNGNLIFKSKDHSYKEWLIERGLEDEAKGMGHIITQAIGGRQPLKPSLAQIENIEKGDHVVLLTDGILEGVSEDEFLKLFTPSKTNQEIITEIVKNCDAKSRDNHTLYILKTK